MKKWGTVKKKIFKQICNIPPFEKKGQNSDNLSDFCSSDEPDE